MQIVIVNVSPDSNRGACALTWASVDLVLDAFPRASLAIVPIAITPPDPAPFRHTLRRYPSVQILPPLFDGQGKGTVALTCRLAKSWSQILFLDRRRQNQNPTLEWIRNCDLAVSVGGVNFETYGGTWRHEARFLVRSLPLIAAQKIDIPAVLIGAQIGPFETRLGGALFRKLATQATTLFPRDAQSAAEVQRRAPHAHSILMPDSAFALMPSNRGRTALDARRIDTGIATLALVISSALRPGEPSHDHVMLFTRVARQLIAAGVIEQIVIVRQSDEDWAISTQLARNLQLEPRCLVDDDLDPEALSNLYGQCRMVISSRLHAVILAMLAGVPAISLAPEVTFKEHAVLASLGLQSLCVPSRIGPQDAARRCLEIARDLDRYRRAVLAAVRTARARLAEIPQRLYEAAATARPSLGHRGTRSHRAEEWSSKTP